MNKITFEQFDELLQFGGAFSDLDETQRIMKAGFIYNLVYSEGEWKDENAPIKNKWITCEMCKKSEENMSFVKIKDDIGFICTACNKQTWGG